MLMMKALSSCSLTSSKFYIQDGEEAFKSFLFVDDLSAYCMHPHIQAVIHYLQIIIYYYCNSQKLKGTVAPVQIGLKVVCLDTPSYVYEPRMVNRFLKVVSIFKFKFKLSQRYIANTIGAACNSRIPPANLRAGLSFVNARNLSL